MTGPAALAAHNDISAGLLRERETSRTPLFLYERDFAEARSQEKTGDPQGRYDLTG